MTYILEDMLRCVYGKWMSFQKSYFYLTDALKGYFFKKNHEYYSNVKWMCQRFYLVH